MKRFIYLAFFVLIAQLLFMPAISQAQVAGGTVIYAAGADPDNLDPANAESNPSEAVNRLMYENIVRFDEKLKIVPGLATKWEQAKDGIRLAVRRHVNRALGRKPLVQTMILEI